jgi:hypothetical protein
MLSPHMRKFSALYEKYGLGAVKNIWLLTCLIPLARTTNLYKMKDYVGGVLGNEASKAESHYKRLIRFFQDWSGKEELVHDIMRHSLKLLWGIGAKTLVLDGTSWRLGDTKIHYMVLSVLLGQIAIPLYWVQLEKLGSSSQEERKAMFEKAMKLFDLSGMTLLADREYVGNTWFKFLRDNNIHFLIRWRLGDYESDVTQAKGKDYWQMYLKCQQKNKIVKKQVMLDGSSYTFVMMPNPKADATEGVLIFATTLPDAKKAAQSYVRRWKIECMFRHMKTNGYNLEDLNLKDSGKNLLMMALLATAYILAVMEGYKRRKQTYTAICRQNRNPRNIILQVWTCLPHHPMLWFDQVYQLHYPDFETSKTPFMQKCPVVWFSSFRIPYSAFRIRITVPSLN